jgi:hypothetical protein
MWELITKKSNEKFSLDFFVAMAKPEAEILCKQNRHRQNPQRCSAQDDRAEILKI